MKVRLTLDVDAHQRYVIARYFRPAAASDKRADRTRTRATRTQVKRFVETAVRSAVKEREDELDAKGRTAARRLREPVPVQGELLIEPREKQRGLAW